MYALAEALKVPLPMAVGIMEMLWHFTAANTPRGDIGSAPDLDIAAAVGWTKKPVLLITALCSEKSRWLDPVEEYRLIVHDWPEHCDQSVRKWLIRNMKQFLPVYGMPVGILPMGGKDAGLCPDIIPDAVQPSREAMAMAKAVGSSSGENSKAFETALADSFHDLADLWQKPCECCEMRFSWKDEMLGAQIWLSLIDKGTITEAILPEIMAGLVRYRASRDWHRDGGKWVPSVSAWLGYSRGGMPAAPKWLDRPTPHKAVEGGY